MSTQNALDETSGKSHPYWPQDAVPERWITELFTRMHRHWGNTFLDKWRDVEMAGLKIEWAKALRKLSSKELKGGVDGLLALKFPPSLPEFYGLCKQMRLHEAPPNETLTDQTRASPDVVEANLRRMREILAPLSKPKEETAEWAFKMLMRGTTQSGAALPVGVINSASDAISSTAGRMVIERCIDPDLAESYRSIREAVLSGYQNAGRKPWENA